jgi:hypothetical protein
MGLFMIHEQSQKIEQRAFKGSTSQKRRFTHQEYFNAPERKFAGDFDEITMYFSVSSELQS